MSEISETYRNPRQLQPHTHLQAHLPAAVLQIPQIRRNHPKRHHLRPLFRGLCFDFGHSSGKAIIRVIVEELGGMRITVPGFKDIYSEERNRKICNLFNGANHKELAIMFDLTEGEDKRDSE